MIEIAPNIAIPDSEIRETFIQASGPGGQNVNKVASAVQLRFDVAASATLAAPVKTRLRQIAGSRMTRQGVLVIEASRFRTQAQNRADARARLTVLIRQAARPPKPRKATRPTRASVERRLERKRRRARTKRLRQVRPDPD